MDNEEVVNVSNLRTDEGIADILRRLKSAKSTVKPVFEDKNEDLPVENTLEIPAEDVPVTAAPDAVEIKQDEDTSFYDDLSLSDSEVLPWFNEADKDIKLIHYIKFDSSGNIVYDTVKATEPTEDLAALKMKSDYVCDIDYYKSRHFVLCVKQIESDYHRSRSFIPTDESLDRSKIITEDASNDKPTLDKVPTESVSDIVATVDKYYHYVVYTDLGTVDFLVRQDDVPYPFGEPNLSKWFEEVSNYVPIKRAKYEVNSRTVSDAASAIKDFKYDIITMHRPGIITLDSVDNSDPNYKVNIKLKDEFSFMPMNRILGCLKYYSSHNNKSTDDLRRMLNKYFNVFV